MLLASLIVCAVITVLIVRGAMAMERDWHRHGENS